MRLSTPPCSSSSSSFTDLDSDFDPDVGLDADADIDTDKGKDVNEDVYIDTKTPSSKRSYALSGKSLSTTLYSLGELGIGWTTLPEASEHALRMVVMEDIRFMKGYFLDFLDLLDLEQVEQELNSEFRDKMDNRIGTEDVRYTEKRGADVREMARYLSNSAYGLSKMYANTGNTNNGDHGDIYDKEVLLQMMGQAMQAAIECLSLSSTRGSYGSTTSVSSFSSVIHNIPLNPNSNGNNGGNSAVGNSNSAATVSDSDAVGRLLHSCATCGVRMRHLKVKGDIEVEGEGEGEVNMAINTNKDKDKDKNVNTAISEFVRHSLSSVRQPLWQALQYTRERGARDGDINGDIGNIDFDFHETMVCGYVNVGICGYVGLFGMLYV